MARMRKWKLVRDKIPGERRVTGARLTAALVAKIYEEAREVSTAVSLKSKNEKICEELGDVIEACLWLGLQYGITPEQIERARMEKLQRKGGFELGVMKNMDSLF